MTLFPLGSVLDSPDMMKLPNQMGWLWSLVPLALFGFALEALMWWRGVGAGLPLRPLWLGLICIFVFMLAAWYKVYEAARKAEGSRQLMTSVLDTLDVGLEIWDPQDRLVLYNQQISRMRIDFRTPDEIGKTFESLLRARLERHQIVEAIGSEDAWMAEVMRTRSSDDKPHLREFADNQWFRVHTQRTEAGYMVTSWTDVTDLARKERQLKEQNSRLLQLTSTDALTGLSNRRYFGEVLATELARAERNASSISLLMIDIDYFKRYNDHYGHVAGDECLRTVADVLRRCVRRAGEMAARYGGEEFVLLLPGSDQAHAIEVVLNCIDLLHERAIEHKSSTISNLVTFSIGVATVTPTGNMTPEIIINAADAAMYRAKMAGRAGYKVAQHGDWIIDRDTPRTSPAALEARPS